MTIGQPFRPNETNKWGNIREGNYTEIDDDGNIDDTVDGSTDGFWVDLHYSNSPAYIEDVTVKVWATKQVTAI